MGNSSSILRSLAFPPSPLYPETGSPNDDSGVCTKLEGPLVLTKLSLRTMVSGTALAMRCMKVRQTEQLLEILGLDPVFNTCDE